VLSRAGLWSVRHPRFTRCLGVIGLHLDYDIACGAPPRRSRRQYVDRPPLIAAARRMHVQPISELHHGHRLKHLRGVISCGVQRGAHAAESCTQSTPAAVAALLGQYEPQSDEGLANYSSADVATASGCSQFKNRICIPLAQPDAATLGRRSGRPTNRLPTRRGPFFASPIATYRRMLPTVRNRVAYRDRSENRARKSATLTISIPLKPPTDSR
jgi:hypothetical protein